MRGHSYVGISGWRYASWRGDFYPSGLPQRAELAYAAERMDSVELNGSFYSLQRPSSYRTWRDQTPDGFVFAVKGGRYITHMLRLRGTRAALGNFFASGVLSLGAKLGPVLWQLPAREGFEADRLEEFLAALPTTMGEAAVLARDHDEKLRHEPDFGDERDAGRPLRHALEARHDSFASEDALEVLRRHGVALVVSDGAGGWPLLRGRTAPFSYVRLHGAEELYTSGYTPEQLDRWSEELCGELASGRDVYVYFDNDAEGHAPHDAVALRQRLGETARALP